MIRQDVTLAESVFLLSLSDTSGRPRSSYISYGLAGAALADLYLTDRAALSEDKSPRLIVSETSQTSTSAYQLACMTRINQASRPNRLHHWVSKLAGIRGQRHLVGEDLAGRGWVEVERGTVFGLFPRTRWRLTPAGQAARAEMRARMAGLMFDERSEVEASIATLISLVGTLHLLKHNFDQNELRIHRRRVREIGKGDWPAAHATRRVIQAVTSATAGAVVT